MGSGAAGVSGWEQRREVTANRLQEIALELFVRHGYPNVSVDDIAAAAGVSARTFHRYFPSKQDVLLQRAVVMEQTTIDRLLLVSNSRPPLRQIRDIYIELTEQAVDLASFRLWRRAMATAPDVQARAAGESRHRMTEVMRRIFAEWLGVDPDVEVRPDAMSAAVLGVNAVAVDRYVKADGREDLVALFLDAFDFLDRGMRDLDRASPRRPAAARRT
jgi:AcrR family transcriptional regulator